MLWGIYFCDFGVQIVKPKVCLEMQEEDLYPLDGWGKQGYIKKNMDLILTMNGNFQLLRNG